MENIIKNFWTDLNEMVEDIEEIGLTVEEANDEYIEVTDEVADESYTLYLGHANSTIWIEKVK